MSGDTWIVLGVIVGILCLVTLVWAIRLLLRLFSYRRMLGELGMSGKLVFWGAIAYTVFPIDILPDPIYLDDVSVLGVAMWILNHMIRKKRAADAANGLLSPDALRPRTPIRR